MGLGFSQGRSTQSVRRLSRGRGQFHRHRQLLHERDERIVSRRVYEGPSREHGAGYEIHHVRSGHRSECGWQPAQKHMMQSVEASLKRLQTDYIDLYWVHMWDQITPVEEVMRGLDDLVRAGKVLYTGISDAPAWWIAQANTLAQLRGWSPFVGLQIEYSLIERSVEREMIPMARALNIGVTAWSPLAGGVLTGKYH